MGEPIPEGEAPAKKERVKRYVCPQCGREYLTPKAFTGHLEVDHRVAPMPPPEPDTIGGLMRFEKTWIDDAYRRGFQHGYEEGYAVGRVDGYQKGYREGKADGYKEGREEGYEEGYSAAQYDESDFQD